MVTIVHRLNSSARLMPAGVIPHLTSILYGVVLPSCSIVSMYTPGISGTVSSLCQASISVSEQSMPDTLYSRAVDCPFTLAIIILPPAVASVCMGYCVASLLVSGVSGHVGSVMPSSARVSTAWYNAAVSSVFPSPR